METESKINQIQMMEQSLQNLLAQKQQFQSQLLEIETAQKEIAPTKSAYKIIGNIMVQKDKAALEGELKEKLDKTAMRLKSIDKQEEKVKERIKALQDEVMADMGKQE